MRPNDFELFLIRHGQAESHAPGGDAFRSLTDHGQKSIERAAKGFIALGWSWSEAWTSPYTRAKQTSQTIWQTIQHSPLVDPVPKPKGTDLLTVHANPHKAVNHIISQGQKQQGARPVLAIFGHQPNLEAIASLLLTQTTSMHIALGKGDVIHLFVPAPSPFDTILDPQEKEPLPHATLLWFYPRHTLEKIGYSNH